MRISHGHSSKSRKSPTYTSWRSMLERCDTRPTENRRELEEREGYVSRGITVCERWKKSFANFLEDMGERPSGLTLDRIDNDKGYCKDNCRWLGRREQVWNRRNVTMLTYRGRELPLGVWARRFGYNAKDMKGLIVNGMTMDQVMAKIRESKSRMKRCRALRVAKQEGK